MRSFPCEWRRTSSRRVSRRAWAVRNGFSIVDQTKIAIENLLLNAAQAMRGEGVLRIRLHESNGRGVLDVADTGPGIPDVELALTDGYTTNGGMGLGLGGSRRLMNEFSIESKPGNGTRISVVRWT